MNETQLALLAYDYYLLQPIKTQEDFDNIGLLLMICTDRQTGRYAALDYVKNIDKFGNSWSFALACEFLEPDEIGKIKAKL